MPPATGVETSEGNQVALSITRLAGAVQSLSRGVREDAIRAAEANVRCSENAFLAAEQQSFLQGIVELEDGKRKSYHFVFLLTGAYLAYCGAPYSVSKSIEGEAVAIYAISGLALSATLVFYSLRFLRALGRSNRRRAFLYKAITTSRAWVMREREDFFRETVLPAGEGYREERRGAHEREVYPNQYEYSMSTVMFFVFMQVLYVLGTIFFVSLLFLVGSGDALSGSDGNASLFQSGELGRAGFACVGLILMWLQFVCNEAAHYQQSTWEARRISVAWPNPIFHSRLKEEAPHVYRILVGLVVLSLLLGAATSVIAVHPDLWAERKEVLILSFFLNPFAAMMLVLVFALGKVLKSLNDFRLEKNAERDRRPFVREFEKGEEQLPA